MSLARAISRGAFLKARFAVNGIQKDSRSFGTVARRAAGVGAIVGALEILLPLEGTAATNRPTLM